MTALRPSTNTPWDFRARGVVMGLIYAVGFFVGINLQYAIYHDIRPTYVILAASLGPAGAHAAAFGPVLLTSIALLLRAWGTAQLSSNVVWDRNVQAGELALRGPYRYVRNPLYLGNIFAAAGIGMLGPPLTLAIVVVAVTLFSLRLIAVEERHLASVHGQAYENYRALVPKLLPRLSPAGPSSRTSASAWADGFRGEVFSFAIVVATLYNAAFTWRRPNWTTWIVLLAALTVHLALRGIARRRAAIIPERPAS